MLCGFKANFCFIFGVLGKVKALMRISPSEFMLKQSWLCFATSILIKIKEEYFLNKIDSWQRPAIATLFYRNRRLVSY